LANADWRPRGLLFDLFGTLVFFDASRLRRVVVGGAERPLTIAEPERLLARLRPTPTVESLLESLWAVSQAFNAETRVSLAEISSPERFRRALIALGVGGEVEAVASELSRSHMEGLASAVVCPPDRRELLETLGASYRLALVSNFDHSTTAYELLRCHGLLDHFAAVVVSEELGLRKPHARTFLKACEGLGLAPQECLHIGDSHEADICGAAAAGIAAMWVDASDAQLAPALARIADVRELPAWLAAR
jgi:HAD superfamily hydrolase (TIGR01549 family)